MDLLYQILIAPIEAVMQLVLSAGYSAVGSYGIATLLLSFLINLGLIPLFHIAEKWQEAERRVQKVLKPKLEEFRQAFAGEERYIMIRTLYRQTGYHPIYAMRSSLGLFLQLPFWIAAYQLLSHYQPLEGTSFLILEDLGKQDKLLWGINLLPFVMTAVNLAAAFLYTRTVSKMEQAQPVILALLFLVLLYNSPSGLLLYWTFNSMFSLARIALLAPVYQERSPGQVAAAGPEEPPPSSSNVYVDPVGGRSRGPTKSRRSAPVWTAQHGDMLKGLLKVALSVRITLFLIVAVLGYVIHGDVLDKHDPAATAAAGISIVLLLYLGLAHAVSSERRQSLGPRRTLNMTLFWVLLAAFTAAHVVGLFDLYPVSHPARKSGSILLALFVLMFASPICDRLAILQNMPNSHSLYAIATVLTGFIVFVGNPVSFYITTDDFTGGVYGLVGKLFIYFVVAVLVSMTFYIALEKAAQNGLTLVAVFLSFSAIMFSSLGVKDAGLMYQFILANPRALIRTPSQIVGETIILLVLFGVTAYVTISYRQSVTRVIGIMLLTSVCMVAIDIHGADHDAVAVNPGLPVDGADIVSFSREKNILIIMLDGFPGGYIQKIKQEAADALSEYDGFVWYPNMLTTNAGTWGSIATLAGGYRYTVQEINNRNVPSLRKAVNEAYSVYSDGFIPKGYEVTYVNPVGSGGCDTIDKRVHCTTTIPYGVHYHNKEEPDVPFLTDRDSNLPLMLMMVSLFKAAPFSLKAAIYNNGTYRGAHTTLLRTMTANAYKAQEWGFLRVLAHGSNVDSKSKTFKFIQLSIPHDPHALSEECRLQPERSTVFAETVCALREIGVLFAWLKDNGIYDATKILVVSDHGWTVDNPMFPPDFVKTIPEGYQQRASAGFAQSLLLVKDFGATGRMVQSDEFLTTPDVPSIVCSTIATCRDIPPDPTKNHIGDRSLVFNVTALPLDEKKTNKFDVMESYEVRQNIFDARNWKRIK